MGAAASVQQIYRESMLWYKKVSPLCLYRLSISAYSVPQYFDEEMYQADFQTIDKDSDGGEPHHAVILKSTYHLHHSDNIQRAAAVDQEEGRRGERCLGNAAQQ